MRGSLVGRLVRSALAATSSPLRCCALFKRRLTESDNRPSVHSLTVNEWRTFGRRKGGELLLCYCGDTLNSTTLHRLVVVVVPGNNIIWGEGITEVDGSGKQNLKAHQQQHPVAVVHKKWWTTREEDGQKRWNKISSTRIFSRVCLRDEDEAEA